MAARIALPFWPTSLDNLSWSTDNLIAVGGGENVAVLLPRLKHAGPNDSRWDIVVFKANAFTAQEIPLQDPLSFANFSIGEELSLRYVHALAWSNAGLAKFGGCALAVLSSNLVLSLWECEGKADNNQSWKRKLIVNHAVRDYYQSSDPIEENAVQAERERAQVRQRIRAFAWSPPVRWEHDSDVGLVNYIGRSHHFLAVSTEAEDVLTFRVDSPHDVYSQYSPERKLTLVHNFNVGAMAESVIHEAQDGIREAEEIGRTSRDVFIADCLAWGPYSNELPGIAQLAFITNGRLFSVPIKGDQYNSGGALARNHRDGERWCLPDRSDVCGPLKFTKAGQLVAFGADTTFCINFLESPPNGMEVGKAWGEMEVTRHHLDGRWDDISGVAITDAGSGQTRINITSHMSTSSTATASLPLPLLDEPTTATPHWQQAINETRASYSAEYDLSDNVLGRTWGVAASPLGDYIATCISMVPSDTIAHVTRTDQICVLNITKETKLPEGVLLPTDGGASAPAEVSMETLFFSLQRQLERINETAGSTDTAVLMTTLALLKAMGLAQFDFAEADSSWDPSYFGDRELLIRFLRFSIYMRSDMLKERLKRLAQITLRGSTNSVQLSADGYQNILQAVLDLPAQLSGEGELSIKIRSIYEVVRAKLNARGAHAAGEEGVREESAVESKQWSESCSICQKDVPFESLKWARCLTGHQFSRCALTFLVIQEPGVSKTCQLCNAQYLNETVLPCFAPVLDEDVNMGDQPIEQAVAVDGVAEGTSEQWVLVTKSVSFAQEPPGSLARLLFTASNICIFCGGKFVA